MNVIGHARAAIGRHPHLADAAIAVALLGATAATTVTAHPAAGTSGPGAAAAAAVACGALTGRRHWPLAVLGVSAAAAEAFLFLTQDASGVLILLAPSIALYTVAERAQRRRGLIAGGAALAALALLHALMRPGMIGPENLAFTALGGLAIAAGDSSRNRRAYLAEVERRADRAERERELDARRRVEQERVRIARDLHDSVGHHLALISVQTDVAGRAVDTDAAAAHEALTHVKTASRKALDELRDTVGLLRQPGDPVAPVSVPAPGLEALDELLATLRASGLAIDCDVNGGVVPLAPAASRTAYRVIQESLTNVCKHSAGRRARLTLGYDRDELRITVDDLGRGPDGAPWAGGQRPAGETAGQTDTTEQGDAAGQAAAAGQADAAHPAANGQPLPAGKHGITGMRERVLALGGRFAAAPRPGQAFRVTAVIPYQPLALAREPLPLAEERLALAQETSP